MTPKRSKEIAEYNRTWPEWIKGRCCQNFCDHEAQEIHHYAGRRGRLLLYKALWVPLCLTCHRWVTDNTTEARLRRLTCPEGQWNNQSLVPK